jgi:hypothetical protein
MLANLQEATKELDTVCHATPRKDDAPLTTQRETSTGNWVMWGQTIDNGTLKELPPKASSSLPVPKTIPSPVILQTMKAGWNTWLATMRLRASRTQ